MLNKLGFVSRTPNNVMYTPQCVCMCVFLQSLAMLHESIAMCLFITGHSTTGHNWPELLSYDKTESDERHKMTCRGNWKNMFRHDFYVGDADLVIVTFITSLLKV